MVVADDEGPFLVEGPQPADRAMNVNTSANLKWFVEWNDATETMFDVYFGIDPLPGAAERCSMRVIRTRHGTTWFPAGRSG